MHLEQVTIAVDDYDVAIDWFTGVLGFELTEDLPALTGDGRAKRWVVVRPPGATTGIVLARADGDEERELIGRQMAGRVGFFLRVEDFDVAYRRMLAASVTFVGAPRDEPYGRVAVFLDVTGNRWDLLGSPPSASSARAMSETPLTVRLRSVVLDCPDPPALAAFYGELLGGRVLGDPHWSEVHVEGLPIKLAFQAVAGYRSPQWPDGLPQQVHLDLTVSDLEDASRRAVALGARVLAGPIEEPGCVFVVHADPAGHPFCLCADQPAP